MNKLLLLITLATSIVAVLTSRLWLRLDDAPSLPAPTPQPYIIAFKQDSVDPHARGVWLNTVLSSNNHARRDLSSKANSDLKLTWNETIFHGFAGTFSEAEIQTLRKQDEVKYIHPDQNFHLATNLRQTDAPWGLSRLSNGITPLPAGSDPTQLGFKYTFNRSSGSGVDIYVLDSGVLESHSDFGGRATFIATFGLGAPGVDTSGHGTHVAGIAAGSKFSVAKRANIFAIKCADDAGGGFASSLISAINLAGILASST